MLSTFIYQYDKRTLFLFLITYLSFLYISFQHHFHVTHVTLNATVFSFSIRVFSIAAVICTVLVLPANYYGRNRERKHIPLESLEVFTIENVEEGSKWYELFLPAQLKLQLVSSLNAWPMPRKNK